MRRLVLIALIAVTAAVVSGSAVARSEVSCNSTVTVSGKRLVVIGTGVNCATAKSIVRGVFNAPSIGTQKVGPLTLVKLRSPRAGWRCITTTPIRTKGAGCRKTGTGLQVIYINTSG